MQIPQEVIEKAIEGGWEDYRPAIVSRYIDDDKLAAIMQDFLYADLYDSKLALDPKFWSSLGKALGWKKTIDPVLVGERIRKERVALGLRQEDLGKELGYTPMGISHFEKGIRTLKISTIDKLSRFFKKDAAYFVPFQDNCIINAHRFYDLVLQKKPTEEFWASLLNNI